MTILMTNLSRYSLIAVAAAMLALTSASFAGEGCNAKKDSSKCGKHEACASCEKCKDGCEGCCKDAEACKTCCAPAEKK